MVYRLQSMYNHMVVRAASCVSPFYSILLAKFVVWIQYTGWHNKGIGRKITLDRYIREPDQSMQQCNPYIYDSARGWDETF